LQSAKGLRQLHDAGIVYGDVSPNNLLLRLTDIDCWTIEELYEKFGKPKSFEVRTIEGHPIPDCAPKIVFEPIQWHDMDIDFFMPELMFVDFAEGRQSDLGTDQTPKGYTVSYAAPESLWQKKIQSEASDVWALACIWFEMRSTTQMFEESSGMEAAVTEQITDAISPAPKDFDPGLSEHDLGIETSPAINDPRMGVEAQSPPPESMRSLRARPHQAWNWLRGLFSKTQEPVDSAADDQIEHLEEHLDEEHPQENEGELGYVDYFGNEPTEPIDASLRGKIENIGNWMEWHYLSLEERLERSREFYEGWSDRGEKMTLADVDHEPPPGPLSDVELADFEDLLSSILKYRPEERLSLENILKHPWMTKEYDEVGEEPWLMKYHPGVEYRIIEM
jgi:serine/threonine protein kinase